MARSTAFPNRPLEAATAGFLPLVGVRAMSTEFGYLLRHYWMPATELTYRVTEIRVEPNGVSTEAERTEIRTMGRCDADRCVWRRRNPLEQNRNWRGVVGTGNTAANGSGELQTNFINDPENSGGGISFLPPISGDLLCEYNRSDQTYHTKSIFGRRWMQENEDEARIAAFLQVPILTPLLPIPVGFRWHVAAESGFLDFHLESVETEEDRTILFVRRRGEFRIGRYFRDGQPIPGSATVSLDGRAAYALQRSTVLEDDVSLTLRSNVPELDGFVLRRETRLQESRFDPGSQPAPLFLTYRIENGTPYLYDCSTGHTVKVDETIQRIVEDWRLLTDEEIIQKYSEIDPVHLRTALADLDGLRHKGLCADHAPREPSRVDRIELDGCEYEAGEFWQKTCEVLILGVTEQCNLSCEYCCYGGKFAGHRTHGPRSMDWETAQKAIRDFLENDQTGDLCPISFYGGEPLLEFELVQRCVRYAETLAQLLGKKVCFALTTNGTLLGDRIVDFLVEHDFLVLISLDGPRDSHDRYRTFADDTGSFEWIETNIRRFAEQYPDYRRRGFNMTLAPPLDLDGTVRFLEQYYPLFPLTRANLVNTGTETRSLEWGEAPTRYGCHTQTPCKAATCRDTDDLDPFRHFGDRDRNSLKQLWSRTVESLKAVGDQGTWQTEPLGMMLFEAPLSGCHRRGIRKRPEWVFFVPCLPGFTRRFVDVEGNYRACERVDHADAYVLGNVRDGPDPNKFMRTMELRRHFGDCGNCPSIKFCDVCLARIPDSDAVETGFDPHFDRQCQQVRQSTVRLLKTYTEIMDANPNAFDRKTETDLSGAKPLYFGTNEHRLESETVSRLVRETVRQ